MASEILADDVVQELCTTGLRSGEITVVAQGPPNRTELSVPDEIMTLLMGMGVPRARARRWAAQCAMGCVLLIVRTNDVSSRRLAEVTFAKYGAETALLRAS